MQGARILRPSPALHRAGIRSVSRIRVNAPYKSPRPVIVRAADDADALASAAASLGTFGTVFGTLFLSLFLVEKRSKGSMEAEIDLLQARAQMLTVLAWDTSHDHDVSDVSCVMGACARCKLHGVPCTCAVLCKRMLQAGAKCLARCVHTEMHMVIAHSTLCMHAAVLCVHDLASMHVMRAVPAA